MVTAYDVLQVEEELALSVFCAWFLRFYSSEQIRVVAWGCFPETVPGTPLTLANTGVKQRFVHAFMAKVMEAVERVIFFPSVWIPRRGHPYQIASK